MEYTDFTGITAEAEAREYLETVKDFGYIGHVVVYNESYVQVRYWIP